MFSHLAFSIARNKKLKIKNSKAFLKKNKNGLGIFERQQKI
jgi:hypothetical protein